MMIEAISFCPASISLLFRTHLKENPIEAGSTGIGFTIDKGVICKIVKGSKNRIFFNKKGIDFPTVAYIKNSLTSETLNIYLTSRLPLGCGFGLSGASALSAAFAINKLLNLNKSQDELIKLSHIAEVVNKTGLGTVATQSQGGFLIRTEPGIPGSSYPLPLTGHKVWAIILGPLKTPQLLTDKKQMDKINYAADAILKTIRKLKNPSFDSLIDYSYEFANKSGLLQNNQATPIIKKIRKHGGHATITMLGQVIIISTKYIQDKKIKLEELTIAKVKPRIIKINN